MNFSSRGHEHIFTLFSAFVLILLMLPGSLPLFPLIFCPFDAFLNAGSCVVNSAPMEKFLIQNGVASLDRLMMIIITNFNGEHYGIID